MKGFRNLGGLIVMESKKLQPNVLAWICETIGPGAEVEWVQRQGGSTSSTLYQVDVLIHGKTVPLMLRRFTNREWLAEEPDLPAHEAANLVILEQVGVPAPEMVAYDLDGSRAGIPSLLMTRLPGRVHLRPANLDHWLRQQAEILPLIHAALPGSKYSWRYAPYNDLTRLAVPAWTRIPDLWQRAIKTVQGSWPDFTPCFIHRDFHPCNILYSEETLTGVIDWPNACLGPAGIDISWNRANLSALFGVEIADRFLEHCQAVMGSQSGYHPFWDLLVAIEFLPDPPGWYPPWSEFGVKAEDPATMLARSDAYLASILARLDG